MRFLILAIVAILLIAAAGWALTLVPGLPPALVWIIVLVVAAVAIYTLAKQGGVA